MLTVSSIAAMLSSVRDNCGDCFDRVVRSIELVVCNFCRKLSNVYFFNFVTKFLTEALGRKLFRLPHVLVNILPSKLNVFHLIILLYYFYTRNSPMK